MSKNYSSLIDTNLIIALQQGAVGVIPTDTLYGLVCIANLQSAVERLYSLKNRIAKLGTVIAADIDQLAELGIKRRYLTAVERFWPGAVSVVLPFSDPQKQFLHQGVPTIPVRIPADKKILALLQRTGPLLTTSANLADQPPASTIGEAKAYFKDMVDFYVDGGNLAGRQPSTIIRIVDDAVEVLREGAVRIDEETGKVLS